MAVGHPWLCLSRRWHLAVEPSACSVASAARNGPCCRPRWRVQGCNMGGRLVDRAGHAVLEVGVAIVGRPWHGCGRCRHLAVECPICSVAASACNVVGHAVLEVGVAAVWRPWKLRGTLCWPVRCSRGCCADTCRPRLRVRCCSVESLRSELVSRAVGLVFAMSRPLPVTVHVAAIGGGSSAATSVATSADRGRPGCSRNRRRPCHVVAGADVSLSNVLFATSDRCMAVAGIGVSQWRIVGVGCAIGIALLVLGRSPWFVVSLCRSAVTAVSSCSRECRRWS